VLTTYARPKTIGRQVDPAALAADLDPAGATCDASTYDEYGTARRCTRRPGHDDDEHRAVSSSDEDGPAGTVAFAWSYEWGGAGYGPASPEPIHTVTVTVTFPQSAIGVDADRITADVLANFWECDHDHVRVDVSSSTTAQ
jgi:hypothetical protein